MALDEDRKFHLFITKSLFCWFPKKFILKTSADVNKDAFIYGYVPDHRTVTYK